MYCVLYSHSYCARGVMANARPNCCMFSELKRLQCCLIIFLPVRSSQGVQWFVRLLKQWTKY